MNIGLIEHFLSYLTMNVHVYSSLFVNTLMRKINKNLKQTMGCLKDLII